MTYNYIVTIIIVIVLALWHTNTIGQVHNRRVLSNVNYQLSSKVEWLKLKYKLTERLNHRRTHYIIMYLICIIYSRTAVDCWTTRHGHFVLRTSLNLQVSPVTITLYQSSQVYYYKAHHYYKVMRDYWITE